MPRYNEHVIYGHKTGTGHIVLMAVVDEKMLPEVQDGKPFVCTGYMLEGNIYSNMMPTIKIDVENLKSRPDLAGMGIAGVATSPIWKSNFFNAKSFL